MPDSQLVNPHGGALVDRMAPESELPELNRIAGEAPHLPVDLFTTMDALNIAVGAFSPLRGFLVEADFRAVCERKQLTSGLTWTVPVLLHVPSTMAKRLKLALSLVDGLFVHPIVGWKKAGDFSQRAQFETYEALLERYYPPKRTLLGGFYCQVRYAGPREAVFHAIVRQNFGCTHIIIGRDHAGVEIGRASCRERV